MDHWKQIETREIGFGQLVIDENVTKTVNNKTLNGAPCYRARIQNLEGFSGGGITVAVAIRALAEEIHAFGEAIRAAAVRP